MLVLHIIRSMDPITGGPCQGIRTSTLELEKLGVQREVVCMDNPTDPFVGKDPFPLHAIGHGVTSWHYNPKLIPWLKENLKRFDVVVLNGLWLYQGYALLSVLNYYKKQNNNEYKIPRFYIMPHGMLDPYFQEAASRKLKAIRNWIYWKLIENKVVEKANGLLFTTETERRLARGTFQPYKPKGEINVGYGVMQPPAFELAMSRAFFGSCTEVKNNPYWLFLSRIHEKKGVDLLLKSYLALLKTDTERARNIPKLVIVGPGLDSAYGQEMVEFISENTELKSTVFFTGMLTGNAKWGAYYNCEAFVLPSHQENFGIAVAEALACGKPVLISDQVNIWREIVAGGSGLVSTDTLDGLYQMLERWVNLGDNERSKIVSNTTETYRKNYSIGPVAHRLRMALFS